MIWRQKATFAENRLAGMEHDGTSLYLENQLCFPLYAAARLTNQIYTPFLKVLDLTYPQYLVLLVLWQFGSLSVHEIGEHLLLESNTLTPLLKRLEEKKFIHRNRSADDERVVMVSLTEKGQRLKSDAIHIPEKIINSFRNDSISTAEITDLQKTLHKLICVLGEQLK